MEINQTLFFIFYIWGQTISSNDFLFYLKMQLAWTLHADVKASVKSNNVQTMFPHINGTRIWIWINFLFELKKKKIVLKAQWVRFSAFSTEMCTLSFWSCAYNLEFFFRLNIAYCGQNICKVQQHVFISWKFHCPLYLSPSPPFPAHLTLLAFLSPSHLSACLCPGRSIAMTWGSF